MTTKKQELPQSVQVGASILFELRAQNVQLMDLRGVKDVTDYFLVATCESEAQMQAILNELRKEFKANKLPSVGVEYKEGVAPFPVRDLRQKSAVKIYRAET